MLPAWTCRRSLAGLQDPRCLCRRPEDFGRGLCRQRQALHTQALSIAAEPLQKRSFLGRARSCAHGRALILAKAHPSEGVCLTIGIVVHGLASDGRAMWLLWQLFAPQELCSTWSGIINAERVPSWQCSDAACSSCVEASLAVSGFARVRLLSPPPSMSNSGSLALLQSRAKLAPASVARDSVQPWSTFFLRALSHMEIVPRLRIAPNQVRLQLHKGVLAQARFSVVCGAVRF